MPKPCTNPVVFENLLSITISDMARLCFLSGRGRIGVIEWKMNGIVSDSMIVKSNIDTAYPFIELGYQSNGHEYNLLVPLIKRVCNTGKGWIWLFKCPITGDCCFKLLLYKNNFVSRKAIPNGVYRHNTISKKYRLSNAIGIKIKRLEKHNKVLSKKRSKIYKGNFTKRVKKMIALNESLSLTIY